MSALQDVEQILSQLTRAEKAQVLQWIIRDLADAFPGIDSTADVLGGEARIVRYFDRVRNAPRWRLKRQAVRRLLGNTRIERICPETPLRVTIQ